jgi:hypothetical protein
VPDRAAAGTCKAIPSTCNGTATCDCLKPITDACGVNHSCEVISETIAIVQCN